MSTTVIVVGLSAASMSFITKLRSVDKECAIICFSAESKMPYNRCLLADVLTQDSNSKEIQLKPDNFFELNNITYHLNHVVTKIDTHQQLIWVGEKSYGYDYLFLGIGTRSFVPAALREQKLSGVFTFHTLSDMEQIENYIVERRPCTAIVIGAGLNGIEAASSLMAKGISVTIIEAQKNLLPGQVEDEIADWLMAKVCHHGVTVLTGRKAMKLCSEQGNVVGVKMDTGSVLSSDMVVIAAGSQLNSELLSGTHIELHQGSIIVSQHLQTNVPNVLAAGDICAVPDFISKKLVRSTTWSDAMLQGLCAATTLTSTPRAYQGAIGLRDSYFFGKDFYACGQTVGHAYSKHIRVLSDDQVDILYVQDGRLMGFVLIGDVSCVPELKKWYVTQEKIL